MPKLIVASLLFLASFCAIAEESECVSYSDIDDRVACDAAERARAQPDRAISDPSTYGGPIKAWCNQLAKRGQAPLDKSNIFMDCLRREDVIYKANQEAYYAKLKQADEVQRQQRADQEAAAREATFAAIQREREQQAAAQLAAERQQEAITRKAAAKSNALKAVCGSDYHELRVGMAVSRAQQCVAPFKLHGQINRKDGVLVNTYRHCSGYSCTYLQAIDGTIAAWSRD